MAMRSWVIKSWPEVVWLPPASVGQWPVFHHMGSDIRLDRDELGRPLGETVWATQFDDGTVLGAAWEWVEAAPGVPAVRDPNGFISNAKLLAADGSEASELDSIVGLNRIAHTVAWQDVVCQVIHSARAGGPASLGADAMDWAGALCRLEAAPGLSKVMPSLARAAPANALMKVQALVA
jgi:hypothetical protein